GAEGASRPSRRGDRMRRRAPELRSSPRKRGPRAANRGVWIPACAGMNGIERREFISLLGGAAAIPSLLWPLAARAQQPTIPIVGYLHSDSPQTVAGLLAAFREGLSETGHIEGQNVASQYPLAR